MDLIEVDVALAPDYFAGVNRDDDVKEKECAAL